MSQLGFRPSSTECGPDSGQHPKLANCSYPSTQNSWLWSFLLWKSSPLIQISPYKIWYLTNHFSLLFGKSFFQKHFHITKIPKIYLRLLNRPWLSFFCAPALHQTANVFSGTGIFHCASIERQCIPLSAGSRQPVLNAPLWFITLRISNTWGLRERAKPSSAP